MVGKLRPESLLPKLTKNKSYIKKMKFAEKRRERAAVEEKGIQLKKNKKKSKDLGETAAKKKKTKKSTSSLPVKKGTKKASKRTSAKSPEPKKAEKKKKKAITGIKGLKKVKKIAKIAAAPTSVITGHTENKQKPVRKTDSDKELIARVICGDEGSGGGSSSGAAPSPSAPQETQDLLHYPYLPFLEDYAEQKRRDTVSEEELLRSADTYFRDLGKKESSMRRAAAKRLREMKEVNRRGGDKDGFRYVVPRNVKEVVRQMMQSAGAENADIDPSQLVSTFGGGDELTQEAAEAEKPVHRRKRNRSTYSDFYQFQVSKRWTRNAENFLNRGKAHKSMFEAKRQQRSIKNL